MLIRSQDKKFLIDIQGIEIYIVGTEIRISRWVDHYDMLGEYSTKEKAMKVLDEIENTYVRFQQRYGSSTGHRDCIYVMPQEDEI